MRPIRALVFGVLSFIFAATISAVVSYFVVVRPRLRRWGVEPGEAELPLPGDELVAQPTATETRGITIDAPVAKVWPWLLQMGFGRAGWYSYDALDNRGNSVDHIVPEYQDLKVGDVMPTHPGGGFVVKVVQPENALVLYSNTTLVKAQAEQALAEDRADLPTAGLKMSGSMLSASFPEFAASWGFFTKPIEGGKTRLIERFRAQTPGHGPAAAVLGEVMGSGIILMTRKQMIGIKERVERSLAPIDQPTNQPTDQPADQALTPEPETVPAI